MKGYKTMMVRVLGIGLRKTGEKNGHSYDFVPCVLAYEDKKNYEGERAVDTLIDGELFDNNPISVGDCLEVSYYWYKKKNGDFAFSVVGIL